MSALYDPPREEQQFLLERVNAIDDLLALASFAHADGDLVRAVLDSGAAFARDVLVPLGAAGDAEGSRLEAGRVKTPCGFPAAYRAYASAGWPGVDLPLDHGGQALPLSAQVAFAEMVNGASVPFGMLTVQLRAATHLLIEHADAALAARIVPPLARGEWAATICITEAEAGSDVGRIRTLAAPRADGSYVVSGAKMFISFGDHDCAPQIIHLLLARTPGAPAGTQGLSLFAVPSRRFADQTPNAIAVSRIEHKMGLRASPTCALQFDGATAYRIGAEGQGLKCLFTMVNLMRLEVAVQGVALAEAATQRAVSYAAERRQGGPADAPPLPIDAHADVQRMLLVMRARTNAMRALVFHAARCLDLARASPEANGRARARALAELLLPVCKTGGAETAFDVASLAVQVFGGHGYICDNGVEGLLRDSRVMAIYEGTSGIQSFDLLARKVLRNQGERYAVLIDAMRADVARHRATPPLVDIAAGLDEAIARLDACTARLRDRAPTDARAVEWAATDYLQLTALVCGAWMWLRMAAAANTGSAADADRRRLARFYGAWLLPQVAVHEARIRLGDPMGEAATSSSPAAPRRRAGEGNIPGSRAR